jgi:hypothetical protein
LIIIFIAFIFSYALYFISPFSALSIFH